MTKTTKPWRQDWTVPDSIKQGSASWRPSDRSGVSSEGPSECVNALCGHDAEHDHGPDCTTDCPCEAGTVTL